MSPSLFSELTLELMFGCREQEMTCPENHDFVDMFSHVAGNESNMLKKIGNRYLMPRLIR